MQGKTAAMTQTLSLSDIEALACDTLVRAGVPTAVATPVASEVANAEAAGERDHGLLGLLRDLRLIRYGLLDPDATPLRKHPRPGVLTLNARHGFAAAALAGVVEDVAQLALTQGVAMMRLEQSSAPGAMIDPVTRLAHDGFVALAFGRDGPGRFASPDHPVATPLPNAPTSPLIALLGLSDAPADDPTGTPVNHSAWLWVADPEIAGQDALGAGIRTSVPTPGPKQEVALTTDLLQQIVTA